jgi:DNA-binding SARP family transcriptional activator/tetratricopeptide (TPR) repeat protein
MDRVHIRLLGGFVLEHRGRPLPPIPGVGRSLLAYLATYSGRRHTRELLAGTFWPEEPEAAARRRLSQALWQLQTALQDIAGASDLITTTVADISIEEDALWLDVAQFDALLAVSTSRGDMQAEIADLTAAVDLYRGEFMEGFYDPWADPERVRLGASYLDCLWRLVSLHKSGADYDTSLAFARRVTLHDPLREEAHREVMRLCFLLGRSTEALSQYDRCAQVLRQELGTDPDLETRQLRANIAELRDKGDRPFAPSAGAPLLARAADVPMVGRDPERRQLLRRFEETLAGRGGVVMVEGSSGVGKTRLLDETAEDAQWRGLTVMRVECREDEQLEPFSSLRTALESGLSRLRAEQLGALLHRLTLAHLARVVPRVREWLPGLPEPLPDERAAGTGRLPRAIGQTLTALADLNPLVLMIDDAQWADEASLTLLADVAGDLERRPISLCLSYRDADAKERPEVWKHLVAIDGSPGSARVTIEPFDLFGSTRLIEESLGVAAVPLDTAEGLYLETGGNPLLLLETLRTWHAETLAEGTRDVSTAAVAAQVTTTGGIAQVVSRRFAGLDDSSRAVLEAVAAMGRATDPVVISSVTGLDRLETLRALDVLIARGALVESSDGYAFAHHQVRAVTLEGLATDRRAELHAAVAAEIERREPDRVEALALHYGEAGDRVKGPRFSRLAGDRAFGLAAFDAAARHYRTAARWAAEDDRFAVLKGLEASLDILGERAEQRRVLDEISNLEPDHPEVARLRARLEDREGNHLSAVRLATAAVDMAADAVSDQRRAALSTLGMTLSHSGRHSEAFPHLEAAVELARGDLFHEAGARTDLGNVYAQAQRYSRAAGELERALVIHERLDDLYGTVRTSGELAIILMEQGDTRRGAELYESALHLAREVGYQRAVAVNLSNLGNARYVMGDLAAALAAYGEATEVFDELGDYRGAALLRANVASVRHTMLGEDTTDDVVRSLDFFQAEVHGWGEAFCREHLATIAYHKGDVGAARDHVDTALALLSDGRNEWVEVHVRRLAAEVELSAGALVAATTHVLHAGTAASRLGLNDVQASLTSLQALIALNGGELAEARALADRAVEQLEDGSERPYVVWYRRYVVATASGEAGVARTSLGTAADLLDAALASLDAATRDRAMTRVPEHKAIADALERTEEKVITVMLASVEAPTGRPLRDDEWIEVRWRVSEPSDMVIVSVSERRRARIIRLLGEAEEQGASARVVDLAHALEVSVATVRRDLTVLRASNIEVGTRRGR